LFISRSNATADLTASLMPATMRMNDPAAAEKARNRRDARPAWVAKLANADAPELVTVTVALREALVAAD
jgi:hypothetical protein